MAGLFEAVKDGVGMRIQGTRKHQILEKVAGEG